MGARRRRGRVRRRRKRRQRGTFVRAALRVVHPVVRGSRLARPAAGVSQPGRVAARMKPDARQAARAGIPIQAAARARFPIRTLAGLIAKNPPVRGNVVEERRGKDRFAYAGREGLFLRCGGRRSWHCRVHGGPRACAIRPVHLRARGRQRYRLRCYACEFRYCACGLRSRARDAQGALQRRGIEGVSALVRRAWRAVPPQRVDGARLR